MSHNMSIYRQLNPRLLVQAGLDLGLLHWAWAYYIGLICLIYISNIHEGAKMKPRLSWKKLRDCPHLMDRSTVPKQVCRGLHLQLACFAPPILQHFPSQKVLLSGENIFACSPSKLPNFVWNIKPPKPLPEFPQLTSIRH